MRIRTIAAAATLVVLGGAAPATAGWVIDQVSSGPSKSRQQVILQANRMKTVVFDGDRPAIAALVDLDAQTMTQIDYAERWYMTVTAREFRETLQGAQQSMRDALEKLPPDQRKMMEDMMRSRMPALGAGTAECRPPRTELRKTGQQATVAGYAATRHEVFVDGQRESEMWIAPGIALGRELDREKMVRFWSEMAVLSACGPAQTKGWRGLDRSWAAMPDGYPVRQIDADGTTTEVVSAAQRAVPAAEFAPPAGFARRSLRDGMSR